MKKEITYCDICGKEKTIDTKQIQVIFTTNQTDGYPVDPYFSTEKIDICADCQALRLKGNHIYGSGAQGYNRYEFKVLPEMKAINIILDERNTPDVFFVEIELDNGHSVNIGERIPYGGLTRLRITAEDIGNAHD